MLICSPKRLIKHFVEVRSLHSLNFDRILVRLWKTPNQAASTEPVVTYVSRTFHLVRKLASWQSPPEILQQKAFENKKIQRIFRELSDDPQPFTSRQSAKQIAWSLDSLHLFNWDLGAGFIGFIGLKRLVLERKRNRERTILGNLYESLRLATSTSFAASTNTKRAIRSWDGYLFRFN